MLSTSDKHSRGGKFHIPFLFRRGSFIDGRSEWMRKIVGKYFNMFKNVSQNVTEYEEM